jgi:predicted TIM-barrel fold metal-dependent hydrolase
MHNARGGTAMAERLRPIDADNHYYETLDAFSRHLPKEFRDRGVKTVQDGRRVEMVMGGRLNRFIPNPTFDPVIVPGCIDLVFRGEVPEGESRASMMKLEPISDAYRDRDARLATMDDQGLDAVLLFPTLGCGVEQALRHDVPATMASVRAFNRWLEDDWGYSYQDRILAVPMISLADPDAAVDEIARVVGLGARALGVRPAPVPTGGPVGRSLGDPVHDVVWAAIAETGVPVAFHLGDSGYHATVNAAWGGSAEFEPFVNIDPLQQALVGDRAIHDTFASLIVHGVFTRHPTLKTMSIENGSDWVHGLLKSLNKIANGRPDAFETAPVDTLRKHVWIAPYYEDDLARLAETIGIEHILFGSDWPHGEGLASPTGYADELVEDHGFGPHEVDLVMRDNAARLLGFPVGSVSGSLATQEGS